MKKPPVLLVIVVVGLAIATIAVKPVVLGGTSELQLGVSSNLSGQISQALASKSSDTTLPVLNKDFTITSTDYFDASAWAVAQIQSVKAGKAIVVLKQQQGIYLPILGPGTAFPASVLQSLPSDVAQALKNNGAIYESLSQ